MHSEQAMSDPRSSDTAQSSSCPSASAAVSVGIGVAAELAALSPAVAQGLLAAAAAAEQPA